MFMTRFVTYLGLLVLCMKIYCLLSVMENGKEVTLDCQAAAAFTNCLKKSVMLVGDVSAIFTTRCREQVLTKLNPSLASLGKEQFPDAGKQLFGEGIEARLKA